MDKQIGFIGAGNMSHSMILGLINSQCPAKHIWALDKNVEKLTQLNQNYGINITTDINKLVLHSDILILATKPQQIQSVSQVLDCHLVQKEQKLLISIAAGITIESLLTWFTPISTIVRAMPNTPALIQQSATALLAAHDVSEDQKKIAQTILSHIGLALWVESEAELDVVTALSGSGPAYYFHFFECFIQSAVELGLPLDTANQLTLQTALGASLLATTHTTDLATLKANVTSKGGTTEAGLNSLEMGGIKDLLKEVLTAATARAKELGESKT